MSQIPTVGRIVHYKLRGTDAAYVADRRAPGIAEVPFKGNPVGEGSVVPMIVTAVWPDEFGPGAPGVNGQAFLDGNDQLWVTSAAEGTAPGQWSWPSRS